MSDVRVRFCPSPTGNPHVGMIRSALFNWAYARHTGGTFVFRIEDTDAARDSEESYDALLASLRWLGLDWDEGPEVGGPYGPYRQSERRDSYAEMVTRLLEGGYAYECYCSTEELEARREQAMAEKRAPGYDGHCRELSDAQKQAFIDEGRPAVVRFRMPDHDFTWDDLIRGEITFAAGQVPDYVLQRANGEPLYTLVNPTDDAAMRITHVLRGEDLLSSTPRQIALYEAMIAVGAFEGPVPSFGHLPYVMGEGNKKLSKRDPESSLQMYRDEGYLPEGLTNYLALLGWSPGGDVEFFSKQQMAEAFTLDRVNPNPARFDLKKCTAINGDWIRHLGLDELVDRLVPYLVRDGVVSDPPSPADVELIRAVVPLISERMETLGQASGMVGFLFTDEIVVDEADAAKILGEQSSEVLAAAEAALSALGEWNTEAIEGALRLALIDGLGLKPKVAFGPVRLAITGRRVSPPLFESMELLGAERSLSRIAALKGA
ncbi:glutamate--tRNA ligase [Candidatus Nanopelagicales bacterium]|nr:glutamate--tRNA ligase [Candidatus Nanopelagicales bacterium]